MHEPVLDLSEEQQDLSLGRLRALTRMGDAPIEIDAAFVQAAERLERRLRRDGRDDLGNEVYRLTSRLVQARIWQGADLTRLRRSLLGIRAKLPDSAEVNRLQ